MDQLAVINCFQNLTILCTEDIWLGIRSASALKPFISQIIEIRNAL